MFTVWITQFMIVLTSDKFYKIITQPLTLGASWPASKFLEKSRQAQNSGSNAMGQKILENEMWNVLFNYIFQQLLHLIQLDYWSA